MIRHLIALATLIPEAHHYWRTQSDPGAEDVMAWVERVVTAKFERGVAS